VRKTSDELSVDLRILMPALKKRFSIEPVAILGSYMQLLHESREQTSGSRVRKVNVVAQDNLSGGGKN